jgi:hypothetical protein
LAGGIRVNPLYTPNRTGVKSLNRRDRLTVTIKGTLHVYRVPGYGWSAESAANSVNIERQADETEVVEPAAVEDHVLHRDRAHQAAGLND